MYRLVVLKLLICLILKNTSGQTNSNTSSFNSSAYALAHRCVWSKCNVNGYPSTYLNYSLDCCTLQVPLNYGQPNGTINISMSRLRPVQSTTINNTLFVLMGGPGGSGWTLFPLVTQFFPASFGIALILPDHRGTGLSTLLSCDDNGSQDVTVNCITYLTSKFGVDGLNQFSVTSAAHDLSVQIQSYKADYPGRISIFAVSYGTFWLNRFLLIYPNLVQSAIMDGVVNPLLSTDSRATFWASSVAVQLLSYCQLQIACSRYFSGDQPIHIMLHNILMELDANEQKCVNNYLTQYTITSEKLRSLLLNLMFAAGTYMDRTVIPAVIYRLNRCNLDDVKVLNFFFQTSLAAANQNGDTPNGPGFITSKALNYNIVQSETYLAINEPDIDQQTILNWYNSSIMAPANPLQYIRLRSQWPKYPLDQYRFQISSYSPLLMLSGQLDPATIFDQSAQLASLTTATRTFYAIPLAGHVSVNIIQAGYACPLRLICSWAFPNIFPSDWNNATCIRDLPTTIDFVGETNLGQTASMKYFNITQPFGQNSSQPTSRSTTIFQYHYLLYFISCLIPVRI